MNKIKTIIGMLVAVFVLTACGPAKVLDIKEIKPNETCWVIPLDSSSLGGQVKFNSVDFLNQRKVSAKRIMIDKVERSTGRLWSDYEWIPAVRVITVDRSLVTREWTDSDKTGTSGRNEAIRVVTKDSVKLKVGLTITASIDEDDASTYLYFHGEKSLADVVDQNVRSFAVAELTKEYSQMSLSEAQTNGPSIYTKLFADAVGVFKAKGITIQYLGNAEGLEYDDPAVQAAINASYTAQQDAKTASQEQAAKKIRNETLVMTQLAAAQAEAGAQEVRNRVTVETAQAQADAAKALLAAKDASQFQNELKINLTLAQAKATLAEKWQGNLPSQIMPEGSQFLLNLGVGSAK